MKKAVVVFIALILGINSFGQSNSNKELENNIDGLFESYSYYNSFIGNVLISKDNHIIYQKSFGYADIEEIKKILKNQYLALPHLQNHSQRLEL